MAEGFFASVQGISRSDLILDMTGFCDMIPLAFKADICRVKRKLQNLLPVVV